VGGAVAAGAGLCAARAGASGPAAPRAGDGAAAVADPWVRYNDKRPLPSPFFPFCDFASFFGLLFPIYLTLFHFACRSVPEPDLPRIRLIFLIIKQFYQMLRKVTKQSQKI
jgi:hypothetical protein